MLACTNLDWFSVSASAGTILVHPVFLEQPSKDMSWFEAAKASSFLSPDVEDIGAIEGLPTSSSEVDGSKLCIWEERRQEQKKRSGFSLNVSQKGVRCKNIRYFSTQVFPWHPRGGKGSVGSAQGKICLVLVWHEQGPAIQPARGRGAARKRGRTHVLDSNSPTEKFQCPSMSWTQVKVPKVEAVRNEKIILFGE